MKYMLLAFSILLLLIEYGSAQAIQSQHFSSIVIASSRKSNDIARSMQTLERIKNRASKKKKERDVLDQQRQQLRKEIQEMSDELTPIRQQLSTMKPQGGYRRKYVVLAKKRNNLIRDIKEKDAACDEIEEQIEVIDDQITEFYTSLYQVKHQVAEAQQDLGHTKDNYLNEVSQKLDTMHKDFRK